jgi:ABC-type polysaccharide/polyol phosphate export permease
MANRGHRWPLLAELLRRELTERYQGSLLGWAWALLQPLAQLAVLSLVFTHLLPARASGGTLPYAVFLALGLWPWQLFANAVARANGALTGNASLLGKVPVPPMLFVFSRVLASQLPDLIGFVLVLAVILLLVSGLSVAGLPVLLLALAVILAWTLALSMAVAVIQVFVRDAEQGVVQLLTLGFFLSPILYDRSQLPTPAAFALAFNPLAAPIETARAALTGAPVPWLILGLSALASALALWLALTLFRRARPHLEDFL